MNSDFSPQPSDFVQPSAIRHLENYTIIETCKQVGIMVKDYLTYVLAELNRGNKVYASLTPSEVALK